MGRGASTCASPSSVAFTPSTPPLCRSQPLPPRQFRIFPTNFQRAGALGVASIQPYTFPTFTFRVGCNERRPQQDGPIIPRQLNHHSQSPLSHTFSTLVLYQHAVSVQQVALHATCFSIAGGTACNLQARGLEAAALSPLPPLSPCPALFVSHSVMTAGDVLVCEVDYWHRLAKALEFRHGVTRVKC